MKEVQLKRVAKALADPQRFSILQRIGTAREMACRQLLSEFTVTPATMSHHLKELSTAGLIETRKQGQCIFARSCPDVVTDYLHELEKRLAPAGRKNG